jgi:small GTP-binding protein
VRSEGRISHVETDQGVWEADEVIIAAGPWSRPLLATAGVDIELQVVRPEQYAITQPQRSAPVDDESVTSIADVGLVGFPNAGKSSLTTRITKARPKTAAYPFTTLHPQIGVIDYSDEVKGTKRLLLADVPGLIEGAHENRGLGHRFLRHIERCALLIFLIDMAGTDARDPRNDYKHLLNELKLYDPKLLKKPRLVVANKMDVPAAAAGRCRRARGRFPGPVITGRPGIAVWRAELLVSGHGRRVASVTVPVARGLGLGRPRPPHTKSPRMPGLGTPIADGWKT